MSCDWPLAFKVVGKCSKSKAKASLLTLPHHTVETPIFMPVGTQGTMKGLTCDQLRMINCQIILANTYHLGMRPVCEFFLVAVGCVEISVNLYLIVFSYLYG